MTEHTAAQIPAPKKVPAEEPDDLTAAHWKEQIKQAKERTEHLKQLRDLRKKYSGRFFWLTCGWLSLILLIVIAAGLGWLELESSVLISLVAGTSVNIIGLAATVAFYLFGGKDS